MVKVSFFSGVLSFLPSFQCQHVFNGMYGRSFMKLIKFQLSVIILCVGNFFDKVMHSYFPAGHFLELGLHQV